MNDKIIVRGKLSNDFVCDICEQPQDIDKEATISLFPPTPAEIEKLKEGDEVLVKTEIKQLYLDGSLKRTERIFTEDIVAILSQQYCSCGYILSPGKVIKVDKVDPLICSKCHLPIRMEIPTRPREEIEKISWSMGESLNGSDMVLRKCVDKINELIQDYNEFKKSHNEQIED